MDYDMEDAINDLGSAIERSEKDAGWAALERLAGMIPENLRVAFEERVAIVRARCRRIVA